MEAASANDMRIIKYDSSIITHNIKEVNVYNVLDSNISSHVKTLKRGQSLLFRMNYYENENFLSELVYSLAVEKTTYPIIPITEILDNEKYIYTYPVPEEKIIYSLKNQIYSGQLSKNNEEVMDIVYNRYIGNVFTNHADRLPGFTEEEIEKIDKTGKIANDENVIFLSFDDWGSDIAIDNILNVLKKHNVKASFFVRTNYVDYNPNLLRAIALDGHDVASHTNNHVTLSNYSEDEKIYTTLTDGQVKVFKDDIVKSYNILKSIIGDVALNKKPALTTYFRPPTLAVSKVGLLAVFDCGYKYSISGDFSTGDYNADSVDEILDLLNNGLYSEKGYKLQSVESGSIVVMHMSDESKYIAKALDIFLTANELKQDNDATKFKFAKLSDYLE